MTFEELLRKEYKTEVEGMLCEAVVRLSSYGPYTRLSPWEVYEKLEVDGQRWMAKKKAEVEGSARGGRTERTEPTELNWGGRIAQSGGDLAYDA